MAELYSSTPLRLNLEAKTLTTRSGTRNRPTTHPLGIYPSERITAVFSTERESDRRQSCRGSPDPPRTSHLADDRTLHLSETLGVAWQPVERGLASIDGVTRRAEITTLTDELGLDSPAARAIAARATRFEKRKPADRATLETERQSQLDTVGLTDHQFEQLCDRHQPADLTRNDTDAVLAWLDSPVGVTKSNGVFSRKDVVQAVVQAVVEWDGIHGHGTRLAFERYRSGPISPSLPGTAPAA